MTKVGQIIADEIDEKVRQTREEVTKEVTEQVTQKEQEKSFQTIISVCQDVGLSVADAVEKLIASYGLTEKIAGEKVQKYWNAV